MKCRCADRKETERTKQSNKQDRHIQREKEEIWREREREKKKKEKERKIMKERHRVESDCTFAPLAPSGSLKKDTEWRVIASCLYLCSAVSLKLPVSLSLSSSFLFSRLSLLESPPPLCLSEFFLSLFFSFSLSSGSLFLLLSCALFL